MILKNKIVIGTLIQFYELNMVDEMIHSYVKMLEPIENKEQVTFHFTINFQEYLEKIDWEYFKEIVRPFRGSIFNKLQNLFEHKLGVTGIYPANLVITYKTNNDLLYTIADYRRDLCWDWCDKVDIVVFGETDTMFGSKSLILIDSLHEYVKDSTPKYVANFAGRKNWDSSWDCITHPMFVNTKLEDVMNDEASEKSYMTYGRMEEINDIEFDLVEIVQLGEPKADGAGLILSSELLKSGVTLPKSILLHGEDEALLRVAKRIMGDDFIQYHFSNYLRVHNRRHPNKRVGILNESNPRGLCSAKDKGDWWVELEHKSKHNLETLFKQSKNETYNK